MRGKGRQGPMVWGWEEPGRLLRPKGRGESRPLSLRLGGCCSGRNGIDLKDARMVGSDAWIVRQPGCQALHGIHMYPTVESTVPRQKST